MTGDAKIKCFDDVVMMRVNLATLTAMDERSAYPNGAVNPPTSDHESVAYHI